MQVTQKAYSILGNSFIDILVCFVIFQFIFIEFELVDEFMLIISYSIFLLALSVHTEKDLTNDDLRNYADLRMNKVHYLVEFFVIRDNYLKFFKLIKKLPQFWQQNSELSYSFFSNVLPLATGALHNFSLKIGKQKLYDNFTK